MRTEVDVNANILTWAIVRAGYELKAFIEYSPMSEMADRRKETTVKQLEAFPKKFIFLWLFISS